MSSIKGLLGEERVSRFLAQLEPPDYRVGNNVIMLGESGQSLQIDHIVLSRFGVFVIETKNYKGLIRGREQDKYWYQYTSTRKYPLYNPIRQNRSHMKELEKLFWKGLTIHSLVCFTERCELQVTCRPNSPSVVIQPFDLLPTIRSYTEEVYTLEQVNYMAEKIRDRVKLYRQSKRDHIGNMLQLRGQVKSALALRGNEILKPDLIHPSRKRDTSPFLK